MNAVVKFLRDLRTTVRLSALYTANTWSFMRDTDKIERGDLVLSHGEFVVFRADVADDVRAFLRGDTSDRVMAALRGEA